MNRAERDQALLLLLKAEERADLETQVSEFIANQLPTVTAETLRLAGELFEDQSKGLPSGEAAAGLLLAALLRVRAAALELEDRNGAGGAWPTLGANSGGG